jgi:VWFA-related protein
LHAFGIFAAAALLAALPAARHAAGQQQEPPGQAPRIRVGVDLVSLFATVRDGKRLVPDLKQEEFRVFEDGQEQKVEFFSRETALPINVGILMDTSGSMDGVLEAEKDAASRFLRRVLQSKDLAFVINFDVDIDLLSDVSQDPDHLERAIRRARINAPGSPVNQGPFPTIQSGGTKFYDAVYLACTEKLALEVGRKAIVVLTDAVDTGSRLKLEDAVEAAQRSDTVVHVIHISDPRFYGFGSGGAGAAKKLADETGGRAIFINSEKDLEKAFDQISEELRSQYTLGYYPTNKDRDGKFRKLKIEATRKGLKVLTRKGYYALAK